MAHLVPGGRGFDRLDDLARRAGHVGQLEHFARALGVDQNLDARILVAEHLHVLRPEHLVDAAMALPEDHFAL